ncbi:MAG: sodium:proton antiporter NhaD [Marinifilaceae bacterium]|jgi:Na+/H+ antiporter NhaD/arsenite permease-like protein|nr:sodium:proton antiporter NhaD [Marinifilaceae bacterium]
MFLLMVVVFVLGYAAIALEHPLKIDKAASALLIGVLTWTIYALYGPQIIALGHSVTWPEWTRMHESEHVMRFVKNELGHHLIEIAEILFFLLGAMTIVETVDKYQGFKIITDKITTTNKVKLLWILSFLTFFMSAALDNLTTTIVLVALLRKLIEDQKTRWFFASMVVLAANAGGAWSPIGDVTTIMLWVKGNVTTGPIIKDVILPSLVTMLVPLTIVSFTLKGNITRPKLDESSNAILTTHKEQLLMLIVGVCALLFVPVFKTLTHLPPFMGMLFGLGVIWTLTEILVRKKTAEQRSQLTVISVLKKIDLATIFFFLGILTAVAALQSAGHLNIMSSWLDKTTGGNIYIINLVIGVLSSIVDNVPLVAGAMGMYAVDPNVGAFAVDGTFWQFLAYCAGTGGSILIIGSAAGVAAMGMEKIDFIWYFKKISLLALIGYLAGAAFYYIEATILWH